MKAQGGHKKPQKSCYTLGLRMFTLMPIFSYFSLILCSLMIQRFIKSGLFQRQQYLTILYFQLLNNYEITVKYSNNTIILKNKTEQMKCQLKIIILMHTKFKASNYKIGSEKPRSQQSRVESFTT